MEKQIGPGTLSVCDSVCLFLIASVIRCHQAAVMPCSGHCCSDQTVINSFCTSTSGWSISWRRSKCTSWSVWLVTAVRRGSTDKSKKASVCLACSLSRDTAAATLPNLCSSDGKISFRKKFRVYLGNAPTTAAEQSSTRR